MKPRAILFDLYGTLIDIETDAEQPRGWDILARFLGYQGLRAVLLLRDTSESQPEVLRCQPDVCLATLDALCRRLLGSTSARM
jgi:hypothetical protein